MARFIDKHSADEYIEAFPSTFTEEEIDVLIDTSAVVAITHVGAIETKYGMAYQVGFDPPDGLREKLFSQGAVESRDKFLADVREFLAGEGVREPVAVTFQRWGRALGLILAEEPDDAPDLPESEDDSEIG